MENSKGKDCPCNASTHFRGLRPSSILRKTQEWSENEGKFLLTFPNIFRVQDTGMKVLVLYMKRILKEHLTDWMLEKNPKGVEA